MIRILTRLHAPPSRLLGAAALAALCVAGCRDAAEDPVAALVAGETRGALALRTELPALPDLAVRGGIEERIPDALELWEASWEAGPVEGEELRAEAYRRAAPELADALGPREARRVLDGVGLALRAVSTLEEDALDTDLQGEVSRARRLHRRAERSLADGDVAGAFSREMEAADALRAVAPPVVANSLLLRAEEALEGGADTVLPEADRERARRMVEGARRAADDEDWPRAIRRAFYASQLLGLPGR